TEEGRGYMPSSLFMLRAGTSCRWLAGRLRKELPGHPQRGAEHAVLTRLDAGPAPPPSQPHAAPRGEAEGRHAEGGAVREIDHNARLDRAGRLLPDQLAALVLLERGG